MPEASFTCKPHGACRKLHAHRILPGPTSNHGNIAKSTNSHFVGCQSRSDHSYASPGPQRIPCKALSRLFQYYSASRAERGAIAASKIRMHVVVYLDATAHCLASFTASDHAYDWAASLATAAPTQALKHDAAPYMSQSPSVYLCRLSCPIGIVHHASGALTATAVTYLVWASRPLRFRHQAA